MASSNTEIANLALLARLRLSSRAFKKRSLCAKRDGASKHRTQNRTQRCARANSANGLGCWWSQTGSNRRPPACKAGALPTELWPLRVEGRKKPEVRSQKEIGSSG